MAYSIPKATDYTLKEGDSGIAVWTLQRTCNRLGIPVSETGIFDHQTVTGAKGLQRQLNTTRDGLVGPETQRLLAQHLCSRQEALSDLPDYLLLSLVMYESGGYLGSVNWSVAGGVDCGMAQRRVYSPDYDNQAIIKQAFDPMYQLGYTGSNVVNLVKLFLSRGRIKKLQTAYRVAVLSHNYPALADEISRHGFADMDPAYKREASWVTTHELYFPDATPIKTPLQWGERYALGNPQHDEPGQAVKLTKWGT